MIRISGAVDDDGIVSCRKVEEVIDHKTIGRVVPGNTGHGGDIRIVGAEITGSAINPVTDKTQARPRTAIVKRTEIA